MEYGLCADEWTFFAEGGAHVVLVYIGELCQLSGMVLRIPKITIDHGCKSVKIPSHSLDEERKINVNFVEYSMKTWFKPSQIPSTTIIDLAVEFTEKIAVKIESLRPEGRKDDSVLVLDRIGYLESNLFRLNSCHPSIVICPTSGVSLNYHMEISVEFKVKSGLTSVSPFLLTNQYCQIKYRMGRFNLMQHYKEAVSRMSQNKTVSWGLFEEPSSYNPRDICSGEDIRIRKAIDALLQNPQNNLRVLVDGVHVFGWNKSCTMDELNQHLIQTSNGGFTIDRFTSLLIDVICKEESFPRLESMQALDCLDSEGAKVLFDRGVELSNGNTVHFIQELQKTLGSPLDMTCNRVDYLDNLFGKCLISEDDHEIEILQGKFKSALAIVDDMSLSQILNSLRILMMGYVAKDASIIIAMELDDSANNEMHCRYQTHVIDVGAKPVEKFAYRADKDLIICKTVCEHGYAKTFA